MTVNVTGAETMKFSFPTGKPRAVASLVAAVVAVALAADGLAADWPDWRGPGLDRHAGEQGLVTSFDPKKGTNVLWTSEEVQGISTPIIVDGRLYSLVRHMPGTSAEAEKVVCLDAVTGDKLWENVFNVYLS
ncbi:MAG: hypothetical protein O3A60_05895, partial [Planctomycetota bacterium]|nr:hypothetical protein [Planctomycetota bacterium]